MTANTKSLQCGTFIRVKKNHRHWWRAGKDGMVVEDFGKAVALIFGFDRYFRRQGCRCVGPELWKKSELDSTTVCT